MDTYSTSPNIEATDKVKAPMMEALETADAEIKNLDAVLTELYKKLDPISSRAPQEQPSDPNKDLAPARAAVVNEIYRQAKDISRLRTAVCKMIAELQI